MADIAAAPTSAGPFTMGIAGGCSDYAGESDGVSGDGVDAEIYRIAMSGRAALEPGALSGHLTSVLSYAGGGSNLHMNLTEPSTGAAVMQHGAADVSSFD